MSSKWQSSEIHMNDSGRGSDNSELFAGADCLRHQVNSNGIEQVFAVDNRMWQVNSDRSDKLIATNIMKEVHSDISDMLFDMNKNTSLQ